MKLRPVLIAAAILFSAPVTAQDIEVGGDLYQKQCRQCHGPTAKGLASYPKLAGQSTEDLTSKLNRYRAGEKIGPNTMLMAPNARDLSDEDIANIVGFITSLDG